MKKIIILLALWSLCITIKSQTTQQSFIRITKEEAVEIAKDVVGTGDYDYYIGEATRRINPSGLPSQNNCWLVFVDEMPNSGWEHPCKYIYVLKKQESLSTVNYQVVEEVRPPANVTLKPVSKPNRYGTKAVMKPVVPKIQGNSPNLAAANTYAVILNGGMSLVSNKERYWNDCSFIYKTLRNVYDVPKQNIKVIMSDGTAPGADMTKETGAYASSPLDLDDDGVADIEYAATKSNLLGSVLGGMAQKLTEDDHLLLFVTGHGGYDKTKKSSYIHLWNGETLYPNELAASLNQVNAGFITVVMEQCNSGGFIEPLKSTNRIVMTACKEDEYSFASSTVPFNEFVYHWTSALNGCDAYGNTINVLEVVPEIRGLLKVIPQGEVSMLDAQVYASRMDVYANGGSQYAHETPLVNFFTNSVVSDLSFSYIPPQVELCFNNTAWNATSQLVTRPPGAIPFYYLNPGPAMSIPLNYYRFWKSPCIWIRNTDDGMENRTTEPIIIEDGDYNAEAHMYIKIRNRGVKPYNTGDASITAFWAQPALAIQESQWRGYSTSDGSEGGMFGSKKIKDVVQPGDVTIQHLINTFNNDSFDTIKVSNGAFCSLAFVRSAKESSKFPVDSDYIAAAWKTNKLAQSNILAHQNAFPFYYNVDLINGKLKEGEFSINIVPDDSLRALLSEADVFFKLSSKLMEAWNNGGKAAEDIEQDKNEQNVFRLKSSNSKMKCLRMEANTSGTIGLKCNFLAANAITTRKEYDIDIALMDDVTGKCYGGETFRVVQEPRPAILPQVSANVLGGSTVLRAGNVSENVIYRWYDADGKIVGTGASFSVPTGKSASAYKLKVEAVSDGAINYATLQSSGYSSIKSVDSQTNPGTVSVSLVTPASEGAVLRIVSASGNTQVTDYKVGTGTMSYDIPAANIPSGIYQISLIEGGNVTGAVKFTK